MKKKEMTRLINFVMLAEKSDPRITADKVSFHKLPLTVIFNFDRWQLVKSGGESRREEVKRREERRKGKLRDKIKKKRRKRKKKAEKWRGTVVKAYSTLSLICSAHYLFTTLYLFSCLKSLCPSFPRVSPPCYLLKNFLPSPPLSCATLSWPALSSTLLFFPRRSYATLICSVLFCSVLYCNVLSCLVLPFHAAAAVGTEEAGERVREGREGKRLKE